ncbi:MAG TPA: C-GCAxxG-C-C family protein [Thermotogota bacterium]|nr:C-GCAxxG-C-C family protein [Thermotogota bacterium]HRW93726.1 C-GCAxxG-C-C family protein [Thermotogota bacterium]
MHVDPVQEALELFSKGYNCCQASLLPFLTGETPQTIEQVLKTTSIFGGGMGRTGQTCGAISGAMMALAWKRGTSTIGNQQKKESVYALASLWMERFRELFSETTCPGLTGFDLSDPIQRQLAQEAHVSEKCARLVETSVRLTQQLLAQTQESQDPSCDSGSNNSSST